ncbi:helix-turn-helix domain-containing protein [Oligoflexus tunisiensis]|uniref:helix-turn-helix domain-containing protein n=1 Tax=Oligoflexus tunisiensis TaxID=708132 RepID=UPI00114D08B7|nr:helix-turn-helix transcriptional regulator [Oligoflexus tunisiensis]
MDELDRVPLYLSRNINELRSRKNLSQQQLAQMAGIPRSTLTHIESGDGNPSLVNLLRVAAALGVGIEELLSRPRSQTSLIPAEKVPVQVRSGGLVRIHKLLPDKFRGIAIDRMEFEPESAMGGQPHLNGTKEYMTVLQGEVVVHVAGENLVVRKGDVLAFPGHQPHGYRNLKKSPAVAISIVIPVPV